LPTVQYGWISWSRHLALHACPARRQASRSDPITTELGIRAHGVDRLCGRTLAEFAGAAIGRWIDRRGPRPTATIIAAGLALACAFMACVNPRSCC
jgi:hypothetical protein